MDNNVNKALADLNASSAQLEIAIKKLQKTLKEMDKKHETVEVKLRIKYSSAGKLDSEQAMYTATRMAVNEHPTSIENGVEVLSVCIDEENLVF